MEPGFIKEIERKARKIVERSEAKDWEPSPRGMMIRDLKLILGQLESLRVLYRNLQLRLRESESAINTELMQIESHWTSERIAIKGKLWALDAERRRLLVTRHEQLTILRTRLLSVLNSYSHLVLDNEN